ncbi:MAG: hypothetical protein WCT30_06025 [Desulfurivibrionaceae bacterium]|jgi:hypothetical protein
MKKILGSGKKIVLPVLADTTGKLAETVWFVSSFVMSLLLGPFAAVPAIIAIFSLKIDGPMPMELS